MKVLFIADSELVGYSGGYGEGQLMVIMVILVNGDLVGYSDGSYPRIIFMVTFVLTLIGCYILHVL